MPLSLDSYLGVSQKALQVYGQRTTVLANNIANADTPNFKAQDIDFRSVMGATSGNAAMQSSLALTGTNSAHLHTAADTSDSAGMKYRTPLAPSLDGNTVDVQQEQAAFADNTVRYQAALTFLSDKFKSLMTAITGQ